MITEALRERRPILIVDIDGTLVDNTHRRHLIPQENQRDPHAWNPFNKACAGDTPIVENVITVRTLIDAGFLAIFVTSRGLDSKPETEDQLMSLGLPVFPLVHRPMDEPRPPSEWKVAVVESIEKYFGYPVTAAIEDDPRVCRAFRERGIAVAQVGSRCASIVTNY